MRGKRKLWRLWTKTANRTAWQGCICSPNICWTTRCQGSIFSIPLRLQIFSHYIHLVKPLNLNSPCNYYRLSLDGSGHTTVLGWAARSEIRLYFTYFWFLSSHWQNFCYICISICMYLCMPIYLHLCLSLQSAISIHGYRYIRIGNITIKDAQLLAFLK